jgi:hypothetical protein
VLSKVVEGVFASRLQDMAKEYSMLPDQHMGNRRGRLTKSALLFLLSQVQAVWNSGNHVATLLSLDVSGAFDRVIPEQLHHNLRIKGVP